MPVISNFFTDVLVVIVVLGVMIFVHEFGHFMAAKWVGVRVLTFSLGFGKRLFGFKRGDTDYRVSILPLGGYVRMAGEDPSQPHTGDPAEFLARPRWQRFFIVTMGPAMNVALAVAVLAALYRYHFEKPAYAEEPMRVGEVEPGSPAAQAGIKPNDVILRLDGVPNPKWEEAELRVSTSAGEAIPLEIARRGRKLSTTLTPKTDRRTGTGFAGWQPCVPALVGLVEPGLPAGQAGLKPGDQIVAVDDKQISCWQDLAPTLQSGDGKPIILTVRRDGREIRFDLTPVYGDVAGIQKWHIGVGLRDLVVVRQLPWPQAVSSAVEESLRNSLLTFEVIGKILTRHMSPKSLSGPIGIAQLSGQAYRSGVPDLLMFVSFISLQLAIFNLLPIPVLDGGVILLLLVEGVIGRDLSVAFKERVVQVGLAVLLLLAVFVMYNDLVKTFRAY